jgi:signal transduction histidine kinase
MYLKLRQWLEPPIFNGDDEKTRVASLLNIIIVVFILLSGSYGLLAPIEPELAWQRAVIIGPFISLLIFLKFILNRGFLRITAWLIVVFLWMVFTFAMFFGADYSNPAYMGYIVVVICAGLVLNWRSAIAWSVFSIITNLVILYLGQMKYLPYSNHSASPPMAFWLAQTVYIIVASFLVSQSLRKIDEALAKARHEIGERRKAEAERKKFIAELEAKNSELERFTYTVSHDLKSPLITIGGYLNFMEKDVSEGRLDKFGDDLKRVRDATIKMQALLNDLLQLSRIGRLTNPPVVTSFESIVRDALSLVEGRILRSHIEVKVQAQLPNIYCDRVRLVEVMQNLLDNAAKFTPPDRNAIIEVGAKVIDAETVFFVKDNGIGIDPAHHERIFGLFNKLDPNSEGTGVGLALVKRTIEVHGGRIWVESIPGQGTTFFFTVAGGPP